MATQSFGQNFYFTQVAIETPKERSEMIIAPRDIDLVQRRSSTSFASRASALRRSQLSTYWREIRLPSGPL